MFFFNSAPVIGLNNPGLQAGAVELPFFFVTIIRQRR